MPLSEGTSVRISYKEYATGLIESNTQPDPTVDPGTTGAQVVRRVSSSLNLVKDTYESQEVRTDRQIVDYRHGVRRVTGSISGEWSPATYWDFIKAACMADDEVVTGSTALELGSVAADNLTSTLTFTNGDPVALGYRVGDIIRLSDLVAGAANNNVNFVIAAFGGTSNREVTVSPAPATMADEPTFNFKTSGRGVAVPSTGHIRRKFAFEEQFDDIDFARLFLECRIGGITLNLPATGLATIEIPVMGRDMGVFEGAAAPFFSTPDPPTDTGIFAAVNGLIRVNNVFVGVITGVTITMTLEPSSDAVVGQNYVPEVFLGSVRVSGTLTAMLENADMINNFVDEDEIDILITLTTTNASDSPAASVHMPRVKFGDASVAVTGMGAQIITMPYVALKDTSTLAGVVQTTIRFFDSEAAA